MAVEQGLPGMRGLDKPEPRLLAASHRAEERRVPWKRSGSDSSETARQRRGTSPARQDDRRRLRLKDQEDSEPAATARSNRDRGSGPWLHRSMRPRIG